MVALNHGFSQNDHEDNVVLALDSKEAVMGEEVCIDLRVFNFDSINSVQASIVFDPYQLRFDSLDNLNPDIPFTSESFGLTELECGIFRFNFFRVDPTFDFEDSTRVLSVCFTAVGEADQFAPVNLSDFPIEVEVIRDFQPVDVNTMDGGAFINQPTQLQSTVRTCAATDIASEDGFMYVSTFAEDTVYPVEFFYSHDNDAFFQGSVILSSDGQEEVIDSLIPGDYNYMVVKGGDTLSSGSATVYDHGPLFSAFNVNPPNCHDDSDGFIELVGAPEDRCVVGKWSSGAIYQPVKSSLSNGTYYHTLIDLGGCQLIDTFVIETEQLELAIEVTDNQCPGDSIGSILVNASGGTPFSGDTYTYTWSDGESQTSINSFRDSLPSGNYEITVTDSNDCQLVESIEIVNESGLAVEMEVIEDIICFGDTTGHVQLDVSYEGRTETPEFLLEMDFDQGELIEEEGRLIFTGLPAGVYELTLTDTLFDGCVLEYAFELTQPDTSLHLAGHELTDESCEGENDGSISLDIRGGEPDSDGNYNVFWSDGNEGAVNSELGEGMYHVTVTDVRGCEVVDSFELQTNIPPVVVESEVTDALCFGEASGSIAVEVLAGTGGPAEITWDDGQTGEVVTDLAAGEYTALVSDSLGCATEFSATVGQPDSLSVDPIITDESEAGEADGSIELEVSGGTPPFAFDWADNVPASDENFAFELVAGEYCVIITDANDCSWEGCFDVDIASSIADLGDELSLSIFPNPTSDFVTVELVDHVGQRVIKGINVSAIDGRIIYEREDINSENIMINTDNWSSGMYFITLRYEGGETIQRLMVQR